MRHPLLTLPLCLLWAFCLAADLNRPDLARLFDGRGVVGCFVVKKGVLPPAPP